MENFLEKISENFEKGIDKQKLLCYNILVRKTCESLMRDKLKNNMLLWRNWQNAADLKSASGNRVRVRLPLGA